jgi:hypothetical protein
MSFRSILPRAVPYHSEDDRLQGYTAHYPATFFKVCPSGRPMQSPPLRPFVRRPLLVMPAAERHLRRNYPELRPSIYGDYADCLSDVD